MTFFDKKNDSKQSYLLKGAQVIDVLGQTIQRKHVFIENQKIAAILDDGETCAADIVVELDADTYIAPGLIDMHAHFRDPGQTHKEDLYTGSRVAVSGGFTSVACMPNTYPPIDSVEVVEYIVNKAAQKALCHVYPIGCLSKSLMGQELAPIEALHEAGCIAFSDDGRPCESDQVFKQAMQICKKLDVPVIEHCEDLPSSKGKTTISAGELAKSMGLEGLGSEVETLDVLRSINLANEVGCKLHLAHLSCKESVAILAKVKHTMPGLSAEVCPHHLFLTVDDIETYQSNAKMYPPLRYSADNDVLKQALKSGLIDAVATDHAPHSSEEKAHDFCACPNGIVGLQSAFAQMLLMVHEKSIDLLGLIASMSSKPAQLLNIPGGHIKVGEKADLCVFNLKKSSILKQDNRSKSDNSPLWDMPLGGEILLTFVSGQCRYDANDILKPGWEL